MEYRFSYRRYRLPFRVPVRTAHGEWREREGVIVRLESENGKMSHGEAAPIPWFGTETVEQAEAACRSIGPKVDDGGLDAVSASLPCLGAALRAARFEMATRPDGTTRQVASLLPAGKAAPGLMKARLEAGFRVFKWKVGVFDVADEWGVLDELCGELPTGAKLRLDANGAWDRRLAERWLEHCADRPVEFVEQPCFAGSEASANEVRRTEDTLSGLAADYPTPLALDESLVSVGDIERWLARGWSGFYVLKTALLGDAPRALAALEKAQADVVFSSALETAIGAKTALELAFGWRGHAHALGFGVWPLFAGEHLNGPAAAPFVRWEDVQALNVEATWNALS